MVGDASTHDTNGENDAGTTGFASWCASLSPAPTFCDDFEGVSLGARWHAVVVDDGGLLERTLAPDRGSTYVATARLPQSSSTGSALMRRRFQGATSTVDCAFDIASDSVFASASYARLFVITWEGPGTLSLEVRLNAPLAVVAVERNYNADGGTRTKTLGAPLEMGAFRRLRFLYKRLPTSTLEAYEDGVRSTTWDLTWVPPNAAAETVVDLGLGYGETKTAASPRVSFDNFACTFAD